jgi:hypothetical protein
MRPLLRATKNIFVSVRHTASASYNDCVNRSAAPRNFLTQPNRPRGAHGCAPKRRSRKSFSVQLSDDIVAERHRATSERINPTHALRHD